tara:strand:+ start:1230 stop:1862 length:633 start_codon:yes stop_codon:yes gene_type:complete
MPNRILRADILMSERVNRLSPEAENFYRRLMSVVDDYGRYHGHMTLLRSQCFPLRIDSVKEKTLEKWVKECEAAGCLRIYVGSDGKNYVEIINFGQQKRALKSKFPDPDPDAADPVMLDIEEKPKEKPKKEEPPKPDVQKMNDEEYLAYLCSEAEFKDIDVRDEAQKCRTWCAKNGATFGRNRLRNWLRRAEPAMSIAKKRSGPPMEVVR